MKLNIQKIIDAGFRGEVKITLMNLGDEDFGIKKGQKVGQMII